jgi:hypothetical protein
MSDTTQPTDLQDSSAWIRATLEKAVRDISGSGVFASDMIEARPIWSIPEKILIGQVRETSDPASFRWIICGTVPTDVISSAVADNPRDALKHFSLKWQLGAARLSDPETREAAGLPDEPFGPGKSEELAAMAEELYAIAQEDRLWPETGPL